MAIEIPHDVALFLNFAGVPYPDINEDQVRALANHVRDFADGVANTYDNATGVIKNIGKVYSGYSYQQLVAAWARMSTTHVADLRAACRVVADALDAAAEVIVATKIAVLAELAGLAASYAVAMGSSILTGGLSFAIEQAIVAAARKICEVMEQALIAYVLSEVIAKAIEPLEHVVDRMIHAVVDDVANRVLGPPATSTGQTLYIEPDEVLQHAATLDGLADDILRLASDFGDKAMALDFTSPTFDGGSNLAPTADPGLDPGGGTGLPGIPAAHAPASIGDHVSPARTAIGPGTSGPAHISTGNPSEPSGAHAPEGNSHALARPAQHAAAGSPGSAAPAHAGVPGAQSNSVPGQVAAGAGGQATANAGAGAGDSASSPGHVVSAGSPTDGSAGHAGSGSTAAYDSGAPAAQYAPDSPVAEHRSPWAADPSAQASAGPDPAQSQSNSLGDAGDADGSSSGSSSPWGRAGRESGQRVTPWRKRTRRKAARSKKVAATPPEQTATPWSGRGVPKKSEREVPKVFAPPAARRSAEPADEDAAATPQSGTRQDPGRPAVVAPSVAGDHRPDVSAETGTPQE